MSSNLLLLIFHNTEILMQSLYFIRGALVYLEVFPLFSDFFKSLLHRDKTEGICDAVDQQKSMS